ncbi:MAG TPA: ABC transporter permease [Syntrophales bacterium]|jgi:phospholipid/cholesterol/gamma-HCH transport system permease protein|nr:ABC transporter permease [Syntrophales bacterium]HPX55020.1 ABC transporter permease [Syntrophales bacterium]HQA82834.1 ABC transporter permease [Syntrophales bacterium]
MVEPIQYIGRKTIGICSAFSEMLVFSSRVLTRALKRKTYNSATKMVLINQLYFTSVQVLPLFLLISVIFGSLLVGSVFQAIKNLGLAEYLGKILMGSVVTELSPFVTVMLITLRSSSAINTEIAVMKVNKELKTLEAFQIDVIDYLFVPRVVSGILSVVFLSALFSIAVLSSGFLFLNLVFGMSADVYAGDLLNSASFSDILITLLKCVTFGFFITLIPIRQGLTASDELTSIPVSVLKGMVNVFIAMVIIEVLSLIIRFI